jgi:hypothetical protein
VAFFAALLALAAVNSSSVGSRPNLARSLASSPIAKRGRGVDAEAGRTSHKPAHVSTQTQQVITGLNTQGTPLRSAQNPTPSLLHGPKTQNPVCSADPKPKTQNPCPGVNVVHHAAADAVLSAFCLALRRRRIRAMREKESRRVGAAVVVRADDVGVAGRGGAGAAAVCRRRRLRSISGWS